jgi:hypothetical protein
MNKPITSSLNQGAQFADMTKTMHGGSRKNLRKNKKMGVAASKSRRNSNKTKKQGQRGGGFFTPYADYSTEFDQQLPADMRALSGVGPLDAKFVELPAIERAAGVMMGGGSKEKLKEQMRRSAEQRNPKKLTASQKLLKEQMRLSKKYHDKQKQKKQRGGSSPVDEPSMLLRTPTEEMDARLNPQWYTENTVIPNFRGPVPIPGGTVSAPLYPSAVPVPATAPAPAPAPTAGGGSRSRKNRGSRRGSKNSRSR